jgi:SAM-dependent methyltransferase
MKRPSRKAKKTHAWPRHPDDWYVEEGWTSARLLEHLQAQGITGPLLDPGCGFGQIVFNAKRLGIEARGSDIKPRWRDFGGFRPSHERLFRQVDFLNGHWPPRGVIYAEPKIIMSNPPFRKVRAFYDAAIARASHVIFLLPSTWLNGAETSAWLETTPLKCVYPLGPRPSMPPGDYLLAGNIPKGGRCDHSWYEWDARVEPRIAGGRPEVMGIRRDDTRRTAS